MSDLPIRCLAVLGAAAMGALGTHGLLRLLATITLLRNRLPLWIGRVLRLLGAIALGSATALWVFGPGFGSFGGLGGSGIGTGSDSADAGTGVASPITGKQPAVQPGPAPIAPSETLAIEVFSHEAAKHLSGAGPQFDSDRRYRGDFGNGPAFFTLDGLEKALLVRQRAEPPLRKVVLVLYKDTPERRTAAVADLKRWLEQDLPAGSHGEKVLVDIEARGQNAPAN